MRRLSVAVVACVILLQAGSWAQSRRSQTEAASGSYSQAQAERGQEVYRQQCASCHAANLSGGLGPALVGDEFLRRWYSGADLFKKVSLSMPQGNVAGLPESQYLDIVAFLLRENGLPAGRALTANDAQLRRMLLSARAKPAAITNARSDAPPSATSGGYYTEAQALRGKAYFDGACSLCHTAVVRPAAPGQPASPFGAGAPPGYGMLLGSRTIWIPVVNPRFAQRWQNVGRLFDKVRTTMPGYDAGGMSLPAYVDMTAYLLQANGFPSGSEELKEGEVLYTKTLLEKGFTQLFNGRDFTGLKFILGPNCLPSGRGSCKTTPEPTFRVKDGTIVSSGTPYGYMYTEKKYLNFDLQFEYRFPPYEGLQSEDNFYGNSGYLLFITENKVWPKTLEIQGMNSSVLGVTPIDTNPKSTEDAAARQRVRKPLGQWNKIQIVSKDGQVRSFLNGTLVSTVTEHEFKEPGHIGFQAEGSEIHWRNIIIREE